ncbi:MAG: GNAT family N-acetyltransferase [Myxococcales bacterium]|nr:GNAT family N-acetyltransferase [Myxococcales bacterium]
MKPAALWPSAQTETWVEAPTRVFEDHGLLGAIRTVSNPTYRWGNCLVLPRPPEPEALPEWEARHRALFPHAAGAVPALYWQAEGVSPALAAALVARGYHVAVEAPLLAPNAGTAAPTLPEGVDVRPARSAQDWRALVDFRLMLGAALPLDFLLRRLAGAWATQQAVDGDWWILVKAGEVLGSMGLFWRDGVARYQDVDTHPDHRGRGLGRLLFHSVRAHGEATGAFQRQVIVADRGSLAHGWYQRMGFQPAPGEVFAYREGPK